MISKSCMDGEAISALPVTCPEDEGCKFGSKARTSAFPNSIDGAIGYTVHSKMYTGDRGQVEFPGARRWLFRHRGDTRRYSNTEICRQGHVSNVKVPKTLNMVISSESTIGAAACNRIKRFGLNYFRELQMESQKVLRISLLL